MLLNQLYIKLKSHRYTFTILMFMVLLYLLMGTGLHGDDYNAIVSMRGDNLWDFLNPDPDRRGLMIFNLITYYGFWWVYPLLGYDHVLIYDLIKVMVHGMSLYFVYKFAQDYLPNDRAIFASIIFIFLPLHDATTYWYMTLPYLLTPALLLYAHHLIRNNRKKQGIPLVVLGAIANYTSPPYVFGLAAIFAFEQKFKNAIIFATPGLLYVIIYFWVKHSYPDAEVRINSDLSILSFMKQLVLQLLTFIEAAIGPSYWLKIFYSVSSIGLVSAFLAVAFIAFAFTRARSFSLKPQASISLYFGLICILLLSFGMFALTGLYSHSAFNLGNRTTVYGSLLIAFLLSIMPINKKSVVLLSLILIVPVFGLSDYWKSWNVHQNNIIENIHTNKGLKTLGPDSTLIVTGNIYSKLGPFSHVEFFSMPWLVNSIFQDSVRSKDIIALTPYIIYRDPFLEDSKFGRQYSLTSNLYVYDSEHDSIKKISSSDLSQLLLEQSKEIRHWVQLTRDTWIQDCVVWLSPRLIYLFD